MKKYKLYLFDLDGTLKTGDKVEKGSIELLNKLEEKKIKYVIISNNGTKTGEGFSLELNKLGFNLTKENVYTTNDAIINYLKKNNISEVFLIGSNSLKENIQKNNIKVTEESNNVIMSLDHNITYDKIKKACIKIQKSNIFIATNPDIRFPSHEGNIPGCGSFVNLVENVTGIKPIIIGKPNANMLKDIMDLYDIKDSETVMIGDNYLTDIKAGFNANCNTIMVKTGVYNNEDIYDKEPTYLIKDLDEIKRTF